ncbi:glycosyltransferase family 39 protein [Cognatishimia sp. MH4019]|uniref:ArnT family glycosyltransferase n=1 Tax=Cognatishimia sp. MH4019 TaxID=2854030 RepID=UPI001CD806DC|nr:glycosyltransferase family 39 protein [Cognatishimia sp. MH4019]
MTSPAPTRSFADRAPYLVAMVLIVVLVGWYTQYIGVGMIAHFDEFYTFERSVSFARMEDWWAVYSRNEPTLKKPPLQYWMIAGLMELGVSDVVALRAPSLLFAGLTLGATALLARLVLPQYPWATASAVLIVASSQAFWNHATSAMLDQGAAFFVTLGLVAMLLAFERPKLWPLFAFVVFLGGLQKGPVALGFLLFAVLSLAVTARLQDIPLRTRVNNRWFWISAFVALVLAFSWQLLQDLRFAQDDAISGSVEKEMINRFVPGVGDEATRSWTTISSLILGKEPIPRLIGFLGLLVIPFTLKRPLLLGLSGIAVIFVLVMWMASGNVYGRYMLLLTPLLAVGTAGLFATVLRKDYLGALAAIALSVAIGGPFIPQSQLGLQTATRNGATFQEVLTPVGAARRDEETFIVCAWDRPMRIPPGAYTVYAAGTQRYIRLRENDLLDALDDWGYVVGPLRGVCSPTEMETLSPMLSDLFTETLPGGYLHWTASGLKTES